MLVLSPYRDALEGDAVKSTECASASALYAPIISVMSSSQLSIWMNNSRRGKGQDLMGAVQDCFVSILVNTADVSFFRD